VYHPKSAAGEALTKSRLTRLISEEHVVARPLHFAGYTVVDYIYDLLMVWLFLMTSVRVIIL
jgi:hypothetical protein